MEEYEMVPDPEVAVNIVLQIIENNSLRLHYVVGREKWAMKIRHVIPVSIYESRVRKVYRLDG